MTESKHGTQQDSQPTDAQALRAALLQGEQPDTIAGYVFTAIGAAGVHAPYGPDTGVFREDLARAIGDWAVDGIARLNGHGNAA